MALLPVDEAIARLLAGVEPLATEQVPLLEAGGRVLATELAAQRTQPPFPASAMDGYAVRAEDASRGAWLRVMGESRAGCRFGARLDRGEAVRVFTGAPVPQGADAILIQENARRDGDQVEVLQSVQPGQFVRRAGLDFEAGDAMLQAGRIVDARTGSLAAAMGFSALPVRRRPRVAILSTGDERVAPGMPTGPDQIVSSNGIGLTLFVRECGGEAVDLGIARDVKDDIEAHVDRALGADILVTIGGISVGEHDLVQASLAARGMALDFWRIAMRPGKPLMVGSLDCMRVLGLPGNPVSAMVCGHVFLKPLIRAMLGLSSNPDLVTARLGAPMPANDGRQEYVRARLGWSAGERIATPFPVQDSSMLSTLAAADALIVRPVNAPAAQEGEPVPVLLI